jgi:hypothetical protein
LICQIEEQGATTDRLRFGRKLYELALVQEAGIKLVERGNEILTWSKTKQRTQNRTPSIVYL